MGSLSLLFTTNNIVTVAIATAAATRIFIVVFVGITFYSFQMGYLYAF